MLDITNYIYNEKIVYEQIEKIYNSVHRNWVDTIYLIQDKKVIKIFRRKNRDYLSHRGRANNLK